MEPKIDKKSDDILEKLVHINRITKVVKGGRRFGFSALVVVGNQAGKIGIAHAKAKQVPDAIKKANEMARRKLIHIPLREGRTIHHDVKAKDGSGRIVLRAASKGTGIIAGGPVRAVCEVLGVKDIVAKSMGTSNAHNVIRATMKALLKQNSPKHISMIRNKKISEIIEKKRIMITLNNRQKINKTKIRVGRGIGSGKGKTSGRGVKGQKSRSGVAIKSFEGGQMPLYRRLPKRGFNPIVKQNIAVINLEKIQKFIDKKSLKSSDILDTELLKKLKLINKNSKKLKILGNGNLKEKINIVADLASKSAIEKLEKLGGSIQLKSN